MTAMTASDTNSFVVIAFMRFGVAFSRPRSRGRMLREWTSALQQPCHQQERCKCPVIVGLGLV
jgi:hypothetical protein